jgi:nitrogen regulatory protein PII 1
VGNVVYDNLPKTTLVMVVDDDKLESAVKIIEDRARTGNIGNGKNFVSSVEEAYTIIRACKLGRFDPHSGSEPLLLRP